MMALANGIYFSELWAGYQNAFFNGLFEYERVQEKH